MANTRYDRPTWVSDEEFRARAAQRAAPIDDEPTEELPADLATFATEWDAEAWDAQAAQSKADYEATQAALRVFGSLPLPGAE